MRFTPLLSLLLLMVQNSHAQGCCGIGGSLVSGGHPVLETSSLLLSASGNYSDANNPDRHRGTADMLIAYGITDRLSLSVKTSYVWAWSSVYQSPIIVQGEELIPGKNIHFKNSAIGDGSAAVQYALIRLTPTNKQELIARISAGIPWGPDRKMVDGVVLPGNVQSGGGGFSLNSSLSYLKALPNLHFSVTSTVAGGLTFKTRKGKDPGDEFSVMLTALFGPFFTTRESITLNYNVIGTTYDERGLPETGSPGRRLSLTPAFEYSIISDLKLLLFTEIPLWRDRNQSLYGNNRSLKAELFWFIRNRRTHLRSIESIDFKRADL